MNVWRTTVVGKDHREIRTAGEAAAKAFFGTNPPADITYDINGEPIRVDRVDEPEMLQGFYTAYVEVRW